MKYASVLAVNYSIKLFKKCVFLIDVQNNHKQAHFIFCESIRYIEIRNGKRLRYKSLPPLWTILWTKALPALLASELYGDWN